jgi:hypothetical protein
MFSVTYVTTASVEGDGYGTRRPPLDHRRCRARRSRRRHRQPGESSRTRYRSGRRAAHLQPRRYRPDHGALAAPDPQSALFDLLNSPANIADATLNGEFLDGTTPEINILPLLSLLPAGTLPPSVDITSLDLVLGGLLSPGSSLLNGISATISGLPVSLTGHAVGPIGSSIELDQAIAMALGFSFPTPAMDTVSPLGDLLSTLTTALDGDLSTALTGLSTDFSALLTDSLANLTSLF